MAKRSKQKKRTGRTKSRIHLQTPQQKQVSATGTSAWERVRGRGAASWGILLGLCTLLGVPGSLWFFWPDIEISPAILRETNQPLSVMFRVENTGRVTLSNIEFDCGFAVRNIPVGNFFLRRGMSPPLVAQRLKPKEAVTVPCDLTAGGEIDLREVSLLTSVSYRSWLPYSGSTLTLHFVGTLVNGKEWHWLQQPDVAREAFE